MRRYTGTFYLALGVISLSLVACGGDDNADGSATSATKAGSSTYLKGVTKTVDRMFEKPGTYESPPTTAPKPQAGKNVWLISCGEAFETCSFPIAAAKEAVETMGWKAKVFDTKGDYTTIGNGVRQAIAANADGIFFFYIDCRYMKAPLQDADKAGVITVAAESADCNDTDPEAKSLFDYVGTYTGGIDKPYPTKMASAAQYFKDWGRLQAMAAIAAKDGKANALIFSDNVGWAASFVKKGMLEAYNACPDCTVDAVEFPITEFGTGLRERTEQELLKRPDVNVVSPTYDNITSGGVSQGVAASGRDIYIGLGEGTTGGMEVLKAGRADVGAGLPLEWDSYQAIDALNRLFHGDKPVPSGIGMELFDRERNADQDPNGAWRPPFDYADIYKRAWTGQG
jgi:ribose transport system substrate-binding protein